MKITAAACFALLSGLSVAGGGDATVQTPWFDETYTSFKVERADKWVTDAGAWRRSATDQTVFSNQVMHLDTRGNDFLLEPGPYRTSTKNQAVAVTSRMTFVACRDGEEWSYTNATPHAAIAMRYVAETDSLTFIGWKATRDGSVIKGRWLDLSAPGVTPVENTYYDVTIDSDYSCIPTRVRYSVNGQVLASADGETWFSSRGGSLDPSQATKQNKYAKYVGFRGRGEVGRVTGVQTAARAARATVAFNALSRPRPGSVATFSVSTNDGQALTGDLSYSWYLVDAAGMRQPAKAGETGASYTLAADDFGHWVAVDVADANGYAGTGRFWFSNLPVVYMDVGTADGYEMSDDGTAQLNTTYFWADEGDNFTALKVEAGADLAPIREQYGNLFVEKTVMTWPSSKKETHAGKITILGNGEYPDQVSNMDFTIHVRGNSTAGADKKPYKIKLGKKTDLFGLGDGVKNKHWVLLANCFDESLMRNKLSYDLSGVLGAPVWMKSEWVDVVMNGQYVGNYQLCQHIRVGEDRIPIYEWDGGKVAENAAAVYSWLTADDEAAIDALLETNCTWITSGRFSYGGTNFVISANKKVKDTPTFDKDGSALVYWKEWNGGDATGGYVFEIDQKKVKGGSSPAPSNFIQNNKGAAGTLLLNVAMNTPEYGFTNPAISNFVWDAWWNLGQAWMSGTGCNADGVHYSELADVDSMVAYWLSQYLPGNDDAAAYSRYAYMDVGGKMVFAPAWDFDYGLGSLQIRIRSAATTNVDGRVTYAPIQPEKWIPGGGSANFMATWTQDPYFVFRLREKYLAIRGYLADMVKDGGLIDSYIEKLGPSARANDLRWNNRIGFFGDANEPGDVAVLREFLTRRFAWFDQKFATVGIAVSNVSQCTYAFTKLHYARSAELLPAFADAEPNAASVETDVVDVGTKLARAPVAVSVAVPASDAKSLDVHVNGIFRGSTPVSSGSARIYLSPDALETGRTNLVAFSAKKADGTVVLRNVALLACTTPDRLAEADGGHGVEIAWLADVWADFKAANPKTELVAPVSYEDYLAFATGPSPYGKSAPLFYDYLAGTSPADPEDSLRVHIAMQADGTPVVSWTPDTPALRATRAYALWGAPGLDSARWARTDAQRPDAGFCATNRFFRISVGLPAAR